MLTAFIELISEKIKAIKKNDLLNNLLDYIISNCNNRDYTFLKLISTNLNDTVFNHFKLLSLLSNDPTYKELKNITDWCRDELGEECQFEVG